MAVHVPLTIEAQPGSAGVDECPTNNVLSSRLIYVCISTGSSQILCTGLYYMTRERKRVWAMGMVFAGMYKNVHALTVLAK